MKFNLNKSIEILERTPQTLHRMLSGISAEWTSVNEGPGSWSAFDVVGHLVHGERTDWIPRLEVILSEGGNKSFQPFNRFAQFEESKGKSLQQLLEEFEELREKNIKTLKSKELNDQDLDKKGIHPDFGEVTAAQLLSTWTVHDLNHISQISRIMASQYKEDVGPWVKYLGILNRG